MFYAFMHLKAQMAVDITTTHTLLFEVVIELFLLIYMFPAVHPLPRLFYLVFYSCKRKLEEKKALKCGIVNNKPIRNKVT